MVHLLLAFFFGSAALLLLVYGIVRITESPERPLSPARRAAILGGVWGVIAFLCLLGWWAWVNPPG